MQRERLRYLGVWLDGCRQLRKNLKLVNILKHLYTTAPGSFQNKGERGISIKYKSHFNTSNNYLI